MRLDLSGGRTHAKADTAGGAAWLIRKRIAYAVVIAGLLILSLFVVTAAAAPLGGRSPLWIYRTSGTINSISISENGSYVCVGIGFNLSSGAVLLFGRGGNLLWEHQLDRIIGGVTISRDGSRIEANGYQILPGRAGVYANAKVYALDSKGIVLWSRNAGIPWSGSISENGSRIAIVGSDTIALFTWEGQIVWNYTAVSPRIGNNSVGPPTYFVSQNGSRVPVGPNGITSLGSGENSILTYYGLNPIPRSAVATTPNGTLIAEETGTSGFNGTVLLLTDQGGLVWEHHVDSAVLSEAVLPNATSVGFVTNWNALFYNRGGTLLANYTTEGSADLLPTKNGLFLLGGGDGNGLVLFNSLGKQIWNDHLYSVLTEAVSSEGAFSAAASGLGGQGGQGHPSTLYFFSTAENGGLSIGIEAWLQNYSQAPLFILFEVVAGMTIIVLLAVLAGMFIRASGNSKRLLQTNLSVPCVPMA